ncbi:MAG: hypothetical protein Q8K60_06185 [Parachlamydiaceae bacterium]|nr:hypothetical protein [Parachlamydiaceae bacterium]
MQKGHLLQFCCQSCQNIILFSVFQIAKQTIQCQSCQLNYDFSDEILARQLHKFQNLCLQIKESKEILSKTSVAMFTGEGKEIKIPYNLLLSRLNSTLDLLVGDRPLTITFRMEPTLEPIS